VKRLEQSRNSVRFGAVRNYIQAFAETIGANGHIPFGELGTLEPRRNGLRDLQPAVDVGGRVVDTV
jgi:hypothetical protein